MQDAAPVNDHTLHSRIGGIDVCPSERGETEFYLAGFLFHTRRDHGSP
jgi:hypothetical protein